jgi:hypothetical protein
MSSEQANSHTTADAAVAAAAAEAGIGVVATSQSLATTGMASSEGIIGMEIGKKREAEKPAASKKKKKRKVSAKKHVPRWSDMFYELSKFRATHGTCMVPFKSGGELGKWVASQRSQFQAMKKAKSSDVKDEGGTARPRWQGNLLEGPECLTEDRVRVLDSIGFVWDVVQADNDARWARRFAELQEYRR